MDVHSVSIVFCSHVHGFNGKSAGLSMIFRNMVLSGRVRFITFTGGCWQPRSSYVAYLIFQLLTHERTLGDEAISKNGWFDQESWWILHGSLNVPIEHHPTIRYMVYNGYYKVMSNIPKMGHLPIPEYHMSRNWTDLSMLGFPQFSPKCRQN